MVEDAYDATADWAEDRYRSFSFANLLSMRNAVAILVAPFCLASIPLGIIGVAFDISSESLGWVFWPVYVVISVVALLAIGSNGVARCRACGARLWRGSFTCRKCGATSAPRVLR